MVVNDAPGEECRIAILEDGHLEELYAERTDSATNVGNIYKGRVVNVEPAIQAAFIDYGQGANGFLHISDLHPRYFPGSGKTERVGKKIPRRERPPIQEALKRGNEVLVQVLKQGIGTKGPTLTSYLSIPGRLLVCMPDMDRVGVSRKVEDENKRREMRKILDTLDLPEGFGFILRTAGFGRTKSDLKRDVAYLMRLWKMMEKRINKVGAPCELYTESDLLIRTVRDVLRPSIDSIIVDSASAYERLSMFLSVIAPRSAPKIIRYTRSTPIFHAFDIERQIDLIHSREVPLPSGGRLVIDQTEALVAIDVNSGKSRSARDSETNAFQTNCEAVDEISRQLRLRDLGGLIVNDLIDMRAQRHRRQIEDRFTQNLKRDRARSTTLRISEFGLIEMTRQRMRPSLRKSHFMTCPHCNGNGEVKSPESVAADVTRQVGFILSHDRIARLELVCSPRVASVLLSRKRRELVHIEDSGGKRVDVRVSDDIAIDRVDYYAYDERNADIELRSLPTPKVPSVKELEKEAEAYIEPEDDEQDEAQEKSGGRRRSRRRRKPALADASAVALAGGFGDDDGDEDDDSKQQDSDGKGGERKSRRRRRRRRRRKSDGESQDQQQERSSGKDGKSEEASSDDGDSGRKQQKSKDDGDGKKDGKKDEKKEPSIDASGFPDKMRLHVLAKQIGMNSKDLLAVCEDKDEVNPKNHMSTVTGEEAALICNWIAEKVADDESADVDAESPGDDDAATPGGDGSEDGKPARRSKRKRRGRRGGGGKGGEAGGAKTDDAAETSDDGKESSEEGEPKTKGRSRRRRSRGGNRGDDLRESGAPKDDAGGGSSGGKSESDGAAQAEASDDASGGDGGREKGGKKGRRRRKKSGSSKDGGKSGGGDDAGSIAAEVKGESGGASDEGGDSGGEAKKSKGRRALYRNRRSVSPNVREKIAEASE